jgi:putative membrane protein
MHMSRIILVLALSSLAVSPLAAQVPAPVPPPPVSKPSTAAPAYMTMAGEADVYEISSSQIALQKSRNSQVRQFASVLIEHHTQTTNTLLAKAKAAGLTPPPAALSPPKIAMIDALEAASPDAFDRVYWIQQVAAHREALAVHSTYASGGDVPQLREAATAAVPIVRGHLDQTMRMAPTG